MARRSSAASRSSARSSSSSSRSRSPRARTDGRVDVACPGCGTQYRVTEEALEEKIECQSCHRTFFPKTQTGKRAQAPNHTKTYLIFGGVTVAMILSFVLLKGGGHDGETKKAPPAARQEETYTRGNHPRTSQVLAWAQAVGRNNPLVLETHSDLRALAATFGLSPDTPSSEIVKAFQTHDSARYLRELDVPSAMLDSEAAMNDPTGAATVYLTARDDNYSKKTRGEIDVQFRMDGAQVKVTGWQVTVKPEGNPDKAPSAAAGKGGPVAPPNTAIAAATVTEVTDENGTRKVLESKVAPVPHWENATPEQRAMADAVVADLLRSVTDNQPVLFNKAMAKVKTLDDRKAAVPRILNALNDLYADLNANNEKVVPLTKAFETWTGFAAAYPKAGSGDAAKDKAARESSIRQYFAYWYRYGNSDLSRYYETEESLEFPTSPDQAPKSGQQPQNPPKKK